MTTLTKVSKVAQVIIEELDQGFISKKSIMVLQKNHNGTSKSLANDLDVIMDRIYDQRPKLTEDQVKQGLDWLNNQRKTPTGAERKNNPFGYMEEEALDTFEFFEFSGFYNNGNAYHDYFLPLYVACGRDHCFEYYVGGGEIHIVG